MGSIGYRLFLAAAASACAIAPRAASAAETSNIYYSLNSLYGSTFDHRHIRDVGAAWEQPLKGGYSAVARFRYLKVSQDAWNEDERDDNVYANIFPATYRLLSFQSALRRHPWEWMPGFFTEAMLGYKHIEGENRDASPGWAFDGFSGGTGTDTESFSNHAFETGVGFGYLWELKRMRFALGFVFGPELLVRNSVSVDGAKSTSSEIVDLLRFNQFEVGLAF
jgi:hypothetical protein